jgi:hypothetical protein
MGVSLPDHGWDRNFFPIKIPGEAVSAQTQAAHRDTESLSISPLNILFSAHYEWLLICFSLFAFAIQAQREKGGGAAQ